MQWQLTKRSLKKLWHVGETNIYTAIDALIARVKADPLIPELARDLSVDPLTLRSMLLLHLPYLSPTTDPKFSVPDKQAIYTINLAERLSTLQHPYRDWLKPPDTTYHVKDLKFTEIDDETARIFHERFHYVGSYRPGKHYALVTPDGRIAFQISTAESDIVHLPQTRTTILTRGFTFRWAPPNCFSYTVARVRCLLKDKQLLLTWHNPNLGLNGTQYHRHHWHIAVREYDTQYRYHDGIFVTQRNYQPDMKVTTNTIPLRPLILLGYPLIRDYNIPEPVDVQRPQQFTV